MNKRYSKECEMLTSLALKQLNLVKNAKKRDFENTPINMICIMADQEQQEFEDEIFDKVDFGMIKLKSEINFQRAREKLGDCAAVLVGLLDKLEQMEKEDEI